MCRLCRDWKTLTWLDGKSAYEAQCTQHRDTILRFFPLDIISHQGRYIESKGITSNDKDQL